MPTRSLMARTRDADEARELASAFLYPQRLDLLDLSTELDMVMYAGEIGPILIADCEYGTDVGIDPGELGSYHVNLPLSGRLRTTHRGRTVDADAGTAAVYQPTGATVLNRWFGDCRQLCIKIEKTALESTLAGCLGRSDVGPIEFEPILDVSTGVGRDWAKLVCLVNDQLRNSGGLIDQPIVAAPLAQGLLAGLLAAAGHPYRRLLDEPAQPCRPPMVARAIEYLHEHADRPVTVADLAAHCWVSVRSLQEGFQRHIGEAPLRHLRTIRLARVRAELLASDPHQVTVASVAHRWGFGHMGRFAAVYTARFGEPPSVTLRASRP
ncbi:MAG: hypothetical protein QOD82_657 [Pseudonocardiales bacterium]|nr:hypothetical protein [Pseudonocardiales bacterium]